MKNNLKRLQKIVGEQLGIDPNKVKPDADFVKELGADSLEVVELIMVIEDEFEIDIEDKIASKIRKVQDVLNYIEGNCKKS
jgi:acyl carrier protein